LRPAAEVGSGPPALLDADEEDDDVVVVELVLVADDVVVSDALVERAVVVDAEESPAKLLHAAVLSSTPVDSSAIPSIRRVRPMILRLLVAAPSAADRRVCGGPPPRRCPETES